MGLVKDRSRFNQKRIQHLEKALSVDISKGHRTERANQRDLSKKLNSIKINQINGTKQIEYPFI